MAVSGGAIAELPGSRRAASARASPRVIRIWYFHCSATASPLVDRTLDRREARRGAVFGALLLLTGKLGKPRLDAMLVVGSANEHAELDAYQFRRANRGGELAMGQLARMPTHAFLCRTPLLG